MISIYAAVLSSTETANLPYRLSDMYHEGVEKASDRALNEAPFVNRPDLIDQQVGVVTDPAGGRDANPQRLSVINHVGGQWNGDGGRMVRIKQGLRLDNQDRARLAGLGPASRV